MIQNNRRAHMLNGNGDWEIQLKVSCIKANILLTCLVSAIPSWLYLSTTSNPIWRNYYWHWVWLIFIIFAIQYTWGLVYIYIYDLLLSWIEQCLSVCSGGWRISGMDLHDPRLLAIAEAEREIFESEYDDYTARDASLAAFFRASALIVSLKLVDKFQPLSICLYWVVTSFSFFCFLVLQLMTLLLRYALTIPDYADDDEDDPSAMLSVS